MSMQLAFALLLTAVSASAQIPSGRWDATITIGGLKVPFTMHLETNGAAISGVVVNGDVRIRSTTGSFDGNMVRLEFEQSGARLEATSVDGGLKGTFGSAKNGMHPFQATLFCTCGFLGEAGPDIMGAWEVPDDRLRLSIRRNGDDTLATVERGAEQIGPLSGRFNGAFFELSYFDGSRAALLEIEPRKDSGLDLTLMEPGVAAKKMKAVRVRSDR